MLDIENIVFTRIKAKMPQKIKDKYPKLNFTSSDSVSKRPQFPTVYVHMLESPEQGMTLDNSNINAVLASFQIEISDNLSQARAKEVADEVVKIMKSMNFTVVVMPFFDNKDGTFRNLSRYRRMIGDGDIL